MRVVGVKYVGKKKPFITDIMTGFKMKAALSVPANKIRTKVVANAKAVQVTQEDSQRYIDSVRISFSQDPRYYTGHTRSVALVEAGKGIPGTGKNNTFHLAIWFEHKYSIMKRAAGAAK